jgi:hypothetical protein
MAEAVCLDDDAWHSPTVALGTSMLMLDSIMMFIPEIANGKRIAQPDSGAFYAK